MSSPTERRRHVVYLTKNTEYHCRDRECVGVRDRTSGQWHRYHEAVRAQLLGAVGPELQICPPAAGLRLFFSGEQPVLTSTLIGTHRPGRDDIFSYANLVVAGEIHC
ncbi:MAG: hypothetical protein IT371_21515 [Deltaproteobacteria bacterium]|nr:hypothetical protein [Deltaproteobacteria bacterium]